MDRANTQRARSRRETLSTSVLLQSCAFATRSGARPGHSQKGLAHLNPARSRATTAASLPRVLLLTGATAVWGSTFVVTKGTLTEMTGAGFLAWRFGIAALVLTLAWSHRLRAMTADDVRRAVLLGIFLAAGFLLQTTGLRDVSAASSGFLTGTMVVLTPLVAAALFGERVSWAGWVAVLMAMAGIALLTLPGGRWVWARC